MDFKKIRLMTKYHVYNDNYFDTCEEIDKGIIPKDNSYPGGPPQLLDALFSGCPLPLARFTKEKYTPQVEEDIKLILEVMPDSLNCTMGQLRLVDNVTPLAAACYNGNIPIHIIELLLKKGANMTLKVNNSHIKLIDLLKGDINPKRFEQIKELFEKQELIRETVKKYAEYNNSALTSALPSVSKNSFFPKLYILIIIIILLLISYFL